MSSRGMFRYDSMTVSSARELASVSMRYSQGGLGSSLQATYGYQQAVTSYNQVLYGILVSVQ